MSRVYRLLHVIDHLGLGGAQEAVLSLARYADRRHFRVEVATLHGRGHYFDCLRQLGVPVHSLSPRKYLPLYLPRLLWLLRRGAFDLVHCHLTYANLIAKPLAALVRVPAVFNCDQNDMYRSRQRLRLWLDGLANRRLTDHITAVSASVRDFLIQREGVPAEKITVVYNGVDLERVRPSETPDQEAWRARWDLPPQTPVVAGVGRLSEQKNFPLFLRVARQVLQDLPQVCFVIAGEGPERGRLEALGRDLGITASVRFLGYVEDMTQLYPALDLLLMTSLAEGTPLTILEAMAMGVPVVAAAVDGMAEVLEDGRDAYLVPAGDQGLFARRLVRLLQDRETAQDFIRAGQEKVRRYYSATVMVQQTERLYLRYLKG